MNSNDQRQAQEASRCLGWMVLGVEGMPKVRQNQGEIEMI
jgi:hypothetical protein